MDALLQIAAAAGAYAPTRHERLQLGKMQAGVGMMALDAGDVGAARAFFVDALRYLDQIEGAA